MSAPDKFTLRNGHSGILGYFFDAVQKYPEKAALCYRGEVLSYKLVDEKTTRLAHYLRSKGVKKDDIVAICLDKGFDVILSIIATLKVGAAYMPVDPGYPKERVAFMLEDAKPQVIISSEKYSALFSNDVAIISDIHTFETGSATPQEADEQNIGAYTYVLFTSGSTGRPKGVLMRQQALVNLIEWQLKDSAMGPGSHTLNFSPITFDVSFQEIFTTLAIGGTLFLIDDDLRLDAASLLSFLENNRINRLFLPFVALQMLCDIATSENVFPQSLKEVMTAGEQLKVTPQVVSFFSAIPGIKLFNQYGPTEAHVVTSLTLEHQPETWPELPTIGIPIDNVPIYILNQKGEEVPSGESGELCIGGIALAEGYMNQDGLTKEKFVQWTDANGNSERIYKTGDLAKVLPDGNIDFLGRIDDQVKIRGYRVELGEIETTLLQNSTISNCVVIAQGENTGEKRIVAYLVAKHNEENTDAIRAFLQDTLPEYMIPSAFVWIDEIPKTASGKVNKKALSTVKFKRPELNVLFQKPRTATEKNIAGVWSELLQIDEIGVDDNFFELGGNSVLAQKTIIALKQKFQYQVPITKLYQYPTISGLQATLEPASLKRSVSKSKKSAATGGIAIIGMAGRFPGADTIEAYWDVLKEGKETISFFTKEEIDKSVPESDLNDPLYVRARGVLEDVDHFDADLFGINPKLTELMDPQMRVFLEVSREVLEKTGRLGDNDLQTIGVFAGANTNTYFNNNVFHHKAKIGTQGYYQTLSVSEKDYLATRVAYHLNLKGPAVNVNAACSTSLLAIAQAVESLRAGQCDVGIAGGVAINVPVKSGHIYEEGAMFSNDGHCRPFDANAKGTVFSDGAGVILLKRLSEAEADGDIIYGIIKGVGVNNDGGGKGSFTAPSTSGQAEAIAMAIQDAGVQPAQISYVETHGTATPLGDPIEVEGLKLAFGDQQKQQYCFIGSVKSNIGHLTHAAGVAGVIKTALSLHHKKLVPSINYQKPNPAIDFDNSPFIVNDQLRDWETEEKRLAGVSSFGIGGTNVHIILEEYNSQPPQAVPQPGPQIINWSARSEKSNLQFAQKLSSFIDKNSSYNLSDISYNLQTMRQPLGIRTAIVAADIADLHCQLSDETLIKAATRTLKESNPNVVFVFPGQGSQFINMGKDLYDTEPVYKAAVDECAALLSEEINEDIRTVIFTEDSDAATEKLKNTFYTQPATFVTSYALAKYYMSLGISPAALAGHSIGEFVCAHLSGILTLPDAIKLVAARARLISQLPGGTMLSVRTAMDKVLALMPSTLSLAANNAPNLCVVSGETAEVEAFSKTLEQHGIVNKPLRTSHAFHSQMMDTIIDPLFQVVSSFKLGVPKIPILSTVTAGWLKDSEATSPAYWSQHARATVNFSDAIKELITELNPVFLETGPGTALTTLIKQQGGAAVSRVVNSIEPGEDKKDIISIKKAIGKLWTLGVSIDWEALHHGNKGQALHDLPTYAYDKKKYWVEPLQIQQPDSSTEQEDVRELMSVETDIKSASRKERLISKLKAMLEEASGNDLGDSNQHLSFIELGFDSLLLTQIASSFKKEFKVPVTFRQLSEEYDTLDKLSGYLDANLPAHVYNEAKKEKAPVSVKADQSKSPVTDTNGNALLETILQQINLLTQQVAQLQQSQAGVALNGSYNNATASTTTAHAPVEIKSDARTVEILDNSNPPVPGARLGKDKSGNPAWFVADSNNPGRYLQIPI